MTTLGIVGSEAAKFTDSTQATARQGIRSMLRIWHPTLVISGHSPLGGIDWWAIEEAEAAGIPTQEYPAAVNRWHGSDGQDGYYERNLKIARNSDVVVCITLKQLPPGYRGMAFPSGCYHCLAEPDDHVKSGGCWTMWRAARLGKKTALVIIPP